MRLLLALLLTGCAPQPRVVVVYPMCEDRAMRPALQCLQGQLGYNGCAWRCTLEPIEQEPARIEALTLGQYTAEMPVGTSTDFLGVDCNRTRCEER